MSIIRFSLYFLLNALLAFPALAEDEFLPAEEAFRIDVTVAGPGMIRAHWEIADQYYLYQERFKFVAADDATTVGEVKFPKAKIKYDESFQKDMAVYHGSVDLMIPVSTTAEKASVRIHWQGCAEAGLCYRPMKKVFDLAVPPGDAVIASAAAGGADQAAPTAVEAEEKTKEERIQDLLLGNKFVMFLGFFIFGILLALTPCVLPMVPILSTIITGQGDDLTTKKAFSLSLVYVLSMAITFAFAGALVGGAGQQALQNPVVLGCFSAILALLSLSMFGLYKLQLPESMQSKLTAFSNKQEGGNFIGVGIMGALSALIVGPCVTAPAAAALLFIAQTGSHMTGFVALLGLGLGMGIPILAFGTAAGHLVPKAGTWMIRVQHIFGFIILGLAIFIVDRVAPPSAIVVASGMLMIGFGVYCNAFDHDSDKEPGWHTAFKSLGLVSLIWGAILLYGGASGATTIFQPLKGLAGAPVAMAQSKSSVESIKVTTIAEMDAEIAKAKDNGKPLMIKFTADWCTTCKAYEKNILPDPKVASLLEQMVFVKFDVTDNTEDQRAAMDRYAIVGPPGFIFYNSEGTEIKKAKINGKKNADEFAERLTKFVL